MLTIPVVLSELQKQGVEQILSNRCSILADPPGAGKTWTTLASIAQDVETVSRCLIVAPTQVLSQWRQEVERIGNLNKTSSGTKSILIFYPKTVAHFLQMMFLKEPEQSIFLFLTPHFVMKLTDYLCNFGLTHVILDESHLYTRPRTKGWMAFSKFLYRVKSRVIFLTANPVQNHISELYAIYRIVIKGGGKLKIGELTSIPIIRRRADTSFLPESTEILRELHMETEEQLQYDAMKQEIAEDTGSRSYLRTMHKEREFQMKSTDSIKTRVVVEDTLRLVHEEKKRVLIVLHRKKHFDVLKTAMEQNGLRVGIWNGSIPQKKRTELLQSWQNYIANKKEIEDMVKRMDSTLFSQFHTLVTPHLDPIPQVLLLQSRAGGVGLNLQMFNAVLIPSLDWNPSSETQAIARSFRRGQLHSHVPIIRYMTMGTIDVDIISRQTTKRSIISEHVKYS